MRGALLALVLVACGGGGESAEPPSAQGGSGGSAGEVAVAGGSAGAAQGDSGGSTAAAGDAGSTASGGLGIGGGPESGGSGGKQPTGGAGGKASGGAGGTGTQSCSAYPACAGANTCVVLGWTKLGDCEIRSYGCGSKMGYERKGGDPYDCDGADCSNALSQLSQECSSSNGGSSGGGPAKCDCYTQYGANKAFCVPLNNAKGWGCTECGANDLDCDGDTVEPLTGSGCEVHSQNYCPI